MSKLYTLDLFFTTIDRTERAQNFLRDANGKLWIIDHAALGLCNGITTRTTLFPEHVLASHRVDDTYIYCTELHNRELFSKVINAIPQELLANTSFTREGLNQLFSDRMAFLEKHLEL